MVAMGGGTCLKAVFAGLRLLAFFSSFESGESIDSACSISVRDILEVVCRSERERKCTSTNNAQDYVKPD